MSLYYSARRAFVRAMMGAALLAVLPFPGRAEDKAALTPAALSQLLSCQSREALELFGEQLFLENRPPAWMRPSALPPALDGMIGLYGFAVAGNVALFGEPVDHVYFMKEWVVALLPRAKAERIIRAQSMARAPMPMTEQYYRFVDPAMGPMIGAFAPTGDALAKLLSGTAGADAAGASAKAPPADMLLVGCNYTIASQEEFLAAARGAEDAMRKVTADMNRMLEDGARLPPK